MMCYLAPGFETLLKQGRYAPANSDMIYRIEIDLNPNS